MIHRWAKAGSSDGCSPYDGGMRGRLLNGRYELRERIGSGGMGEVWRAYDTALERDVAVKVFMPQRGAADEADRAELLGRFQREARSAAALDSPHIVAVHDHGTDAGADDAAGDGAAREPRAPTPYLVMALVHGRSLHDLLLERGRMPLTAALSWTADVCRALRVAHEAGVVHRDIKPANIMVEGGLGGTGRRDPEPEPGAEREHRPQPEAGAEPGAGAAGAAREQEAGAADGPEAEVAPGTAKVVDFGIAKFVEARSTDPQLTNTGQMPFGSVLYMAPEQFRQEDADGRTDLYALGCVLYELLVGRPPFTGSAAGVMYNHLHDTPLLPSRARPELSTAVDRLVLSLMARDRDGRPADAQTALAAVEAVRDTVAARAPADGSGAPGGTRTRGTNGTPGAGGTPGTGDSPAAGVRGAATGGAGAAARTSAVGSGAAAEPADTPPGGGRPGTAPSASPSPSPSSSPGTGDGTGTDSGSGTGTGTGSSSGDPYPVPKQPGYARPGRIWSEGEFTPRNTRGRSPLHPRDPEHGPRRLGRWVAGAVGGFLLLTVTVPLVAYSDQDTPVAAPPPPDLPSSSPHEKVPDEYVIGIARDEYEDDPSLAQGRKKVVEAAVAEAERRHKRDIPVRVASVEADDGGGGEAALSEHPELVAVVGDVYDFSGGTDEFFSEVPAVETCEGSRSVDVNFSTATSEHDLTTAEAGYLGRTLGTRTVLNAADDFPVGDALESMHIKTVRPQDPEEMSEDEVRERIRKTGADAVALPDSEAAGVWARAAEKEKVQVIVQQGYAQTCDPPASQDAAEEYELAVPDGALRFRTFYDGKQRPDCAELPEVCAAPESTRRLLRQRGSAELYDGALAAAEAMAGVLDEKPLPSLARAQLMKTLGDEETKGLLGRYVFDGRHVSDRPVWVDRRENGKWKQLKRLEP